MGQNTAIEWTDHTFNPWWGAETFAKRTGNAVRGPNAPRRFFGAKHWAEPLKWNEKAKAEGVRRRVFCASMADVFEELPDGHPDAERIKQERGRLFELIKVTPNLDWLLLTKRPENIARMLPEDWGNGYPNVWLGTTVENQEYADKRIPELLNVPAAVRFLSVEPMLGPVDLRDWIGDCGCVACDRHYITDLDSLDIPDPEDDYVNTRCPECQADIVSFAGWADKKMYRGIHWVICGGESGPGAHPMHPGWARSLRDQCVASGVAYHFKQWGEWEPNRILPGRRAAVVLPDGQRRYEGDPNWGEFIDWKCQCEICYCAKLGKKAAGRLLDGREWNEFPEASP